jgi:hypothetical protein
MPNVLDFPDAEGRQDRELTAYYLSQKKELEGLNAVLNDLTRLVRHLKYLGEHNSSRSQPAILRIIPGGLVDATREGQRPNP